MAWEFAAIVRKDGDQISSQMDNRNVKENLLKWVLVSPGKNPNPPRIKFEFPKDLQGKYHPKPEKGWYSPINKPYWAFTDYEDKVFNGKEDEHKRTAKKLEGKVSIVGKTRKIHFESSDLLSLINEAGKEGWEITGGIGLADGRETRYRMMRREI
jgi:hypothetical protein